jgi:hypothetical protein
MSKCARPCCETIGIFQFCNDCGREQYCGRECQVCIYMCIYVRVFFYTYKYIYIYIYM